jgi:hypothetical protein
VSEAAAVMCSAVLVTTTTVLCVTLHQHCVHA